MKRIIAVLLSLPLMLSLVAFAPAKSVIIRGEAAEVIEETEEETAEAPAEEAAAEEVSEEAPAEDTAEEAAEEAPAEAAAPAATYTGNFDDAVAEAVNSVIGDLTAKYDELIANVDSIEAYIENEEAVNGFYAEIVDTTDALGITLREYCLQCARESVANNADDFDDMSDDIEDIYDEVYSDACDDIYDDIYYGIIEDLYEAFYNGIVDEAYDTLEYEEWEVLSDAAYASWQDANYAVSDIYSDLQNDVYAFYYELDDKMWDEDIDKVNQIIDDFAFDIEVLKGNAVREDTEATLAVKASVEALTAGYEELVSVIDSYEAFAENVDAVKAYYEFVVEEVAALDISLRNFAADQAEAIIASGMSFEDMQDEFKHIYDDNKEYAGDLISAEIEDGLLEDLYNTFYDGILKEASSSDEDYSYKAGKLRSREYDRWWAASDDFDSLMYDLSDDLSDFYYAMNDGFYYEDTEALTAAVEDFRLLTGKLDGTAELTPCEQDIADTTAALTADYETLISEVATYEDYIANVDRVEAFYAQVADETVALCDRIYGYAADRAEGLLAAEADDEARSMILESIYDEFYDDAFDAIEDDILDNILDGLYDAYYDGIIDDIYYDAADGEEIDYDEWYDLSDDAYDMWSDADDDAYDAFYDTRDDIYDFYSDLQSALWDEDEEALEEVIRSFEEDCGYAPSDDAETEDDVEIEDDVEAEDDGEIEDDGEEAGAADHEGLSEEFMATMTELENFMEGFYALVEEYNEDPENLEILEKMDAFLVEYEDMEDRLEGFDEDNLSQEEIEYLENFYLEMEERMSELGM